MESIVKLESSENQERKPSQKMSSLHSHLLFTKTIRWGYFPWSVPLPSYAIITAHTRQKRDVLSEIHFLSTWRQVIRDRASSSPAIISSHLTVTTYTLQQRGGMTACDSEKTWSKAENSTKTQKKLAGTTYTLQQRGWRGLHVVVRIRDQRWEIQQKEYNN